MYFRFCNDRKKKGKTIKKIWILTVLANCLLRTVYQVYDLKA